MICCKIYYDFGQLSEVRLNETIENIAGEKLKNSTSDLEISEIYRMALKDLGYDNVQIIFSDPKNSPQLLDEKGLKSTGRATNEYFQDKYKGDDVAISIQSDGKDYSNVDFGENVGDKANEGATIYLDDLRTKNRTIGNKKIYYTEDEIQNNINWWFGKDSYKIDWNKYEKDI